MYIYIYIYVYIYIYIYIYICIYVYILHHHDGPYIMGRAFEDRGFSSLAPCSTLPWQRQFLGPRVLFKVMSGAF